MAQTRVINYTTALVAAPLWLLGGTIPSASRWWQPRLPACFSSPGRSSAAGLEHRRRLSRHAGTGCENSSRRPADRRVIGDPIGARLWTARLKQRGRFAILNVVERIPHRRVGTTIMLAALGPARTRASTCGPEVVARVGTGRIVRDRDGVCGRVFSFPSSVRRAAKRIRRTEIARLHSWLAAGAMGFAVQGLTSSTSISIYRHAPTANVLYSSRGLWSVVAYGASARFTNSRAASGRARVGGATGRGDPVDGGLDDGVVS